MTNEDLNEFRREFEALKQQSLAACEDGSCELEEGYEEYPDYLKAIYHEVMPPIKSGVYISRWDLKNIAEQLDESIALDVRERMFKKLMQWIGSPEDMRRLIDVFGELIDAKCDTYREFVQRYPSMEDIFEPKIVKAQKAKRY